MLNLLDPHMGADASFSNKRGLINPVAEQCFVAWRFDVMRITDSAAVSEIRYDPKRRELFVRYRSGDPYLYFDVPPDEAQSFKEAESKGHYVHDHILNHYRYRRLDS